MNRLLLLEDEKNIGLTLSENLRAEGFEVDWAKSVSEGRRLLFDGTYDLALLDVMLPDGSGLDLAMEIRAKHPLTSILFLSAAGTAEDRIKGLELGAADYVVKPFHWKELLLRVKNTLNQQPSRTASPDQPIQIGRALISLSSFELETPTDGKIQLSQKECRLLQLLLEAPGKVVSRDEILDTVWSQNEYPSSRTVDNFILRLRKWIEPVPEKPHHILTVRGVGYRLKF